MSGDPARRRPARHPWAWVLASALGLTTLAVHGARDLEFVTRLEAFLPAGSPAADAYRDFLSTFGGFESVHAVLVWRGPSPDPAVLAEAAATVGDRLAAQPEVAAVTSGLEPEDEEFLYRRVLPRAPLFLGEADGAAERLDPARVRGRVAELRRALLTPSGSALARWRAADPLGFAGDPSRLAAAGSAGQLDPMTGALLSRGGDAVLLSVEPSVGTLDTAAGRRLAAAFESAAAELAVAFPGAPLDLVAAGGPLYAAQDEALVRADLVRTLSGSMLSIALFLLLYFGGVGLPAALAATLAAGVAWTAGLAALFFGELSVLGVSCAAMLLGLGVDYGIHGASRFRAARFDAVPAGAAVRAAMRETGPAILASVATTVAAFLVLSRAHFRPVRELGQVMTLGILAVLAATVAVGAPLLALAGGGTRSPSPGGPRTVAWRLVGRMTDAMVDLGSQRPRSVLLAAAGLTLAALAGVSQLQVSLDLRSLRPRNHPAFEAEALLTERFGVGLEGFSVIVRGGSLAEALGRARRVARALEAELPAGASVLSVADWLPDEHAMADRLREVGGEPARAAAAALRQAISAEGLRPEPFAEALAVLDAAGRGEFPSSIPETAWPGWLADLVDRTAGETAVAVPVTTPLGTWPEGPPAELVEALESIEPGVVVASAPRVGGELRRMVAADVSRLGGWGLAAVAAVVLAVFRGRPLPAVLALLPVTLGGLWTLGLAGAAGVPLDPFSIVVAPLLIGIGIDDGLHALVGSGVHGGLLASLRHNGRAMALTTLTTSAAFASLVASQVPSLRTGGVLVAAGAVSCLLVTLVLLPAVAGLTVRAGDAT